jgi:group II intron reverse transcriptase/maturase
LSSLYDKDWRADVLGVAWRQVKANKGAPGGDGKAIDVMVETGQEEDMIQKLQEALRAKHDTFAPVRVVEIPKPNGGTRPLGMATGEDRVVQTAMNLVLAPLFEADFHDCSYGYRPKRNARQASLAIQDDGYQRTWGVVELDVQSYCTSIPHRKLLPRLTRRIADGSMLELMQQPLKVGVKDQGQVGPTTFGGPQGSPISPVYSHISLNRLDQLWHSRSYPAKLGATLHRYADDASLMCRRRPQPVLAALKAIATRMDLTINRDKTHVARLTDGFDFSGFQFVKRKSPSRGKNTIDMFPAKSAQQKIRNLLKHLTSRRAPSSPQAFVDMVNPMVTGWANDCRHTNASQAFRRLQCFVTIRLRRDLTHSSNGRGFGWQLFPNSKLSMMGLVSIGSGLLEDMATPGHDGR